MFVFAQYYSQQHFSDFNFIALVSPSITLSITVTKAFPYSFVARHLYVSACSEETFGICERKKSETLKHTLLAFFLCNIVVLYGIVTDNTYLKCMLTSEWVKFRLILLRIRNLSIISGPCDCWCWLSSNNGFKNGQFTCGKQDIL